MNFRRMGRGSNKETWEGALRRVLRHREDRPMWLRDYERLRARGYSTFAAAYEVVATLSAGSS